MRTKLGFIDREWGLCKSKTVEGDMGFTFCDRPETLTRDIDTMRRKSLEYINGQDCVDDDDVYDEVTGLFAIYLVYVVSVNLRPSQDPTYARVNYYDGKLTDVYVCATKDVAGWIEKEKEYRAEGVTIHYRES